MAPPDFEESLRNALKQCREDFDYIFLDAQAGADSFAKVSMTRGISDEVVIVSEFDRVSAADVERLKGLLPKVLYFDRTWVLLNKRRVLLGVTFHFGLIMVIGLIFSLPQHDLVRFLLHLAAIFLLAVIGYHLSPEDALGMEVTELWARIFGPRMADSAVARDRISREEEQIKDRIAKLEAFLKLEADALFKLRITKEAVDLVASGRPG